MRTSGTCAWLAWQGSFNCDTFQDWIRVTRMHKYISLYNQRSLQKIAFRNILKIISRPGLCLNPENKWFILHEIQRKFHDKRFLETTK